MIEIISKEIRELLGRFPTENDKIIFNNKQLIVDKHLFQKIPNIPDDLNSCKKTIAFVDGGQAEIISTGTFCLSFIRVFAQVFQDNQKKEFIKNEFYLFIKSVWKNEDLFYESKIFPLNEKLIDESDLSISSQHSSIKSGNERAPISKITNTARRFAELSLAKKIKKEFNLDYVLLDGTLTPTFENEEKFIRLLPKNVCALAKTSSLFTLSGNSPLILLNKIAPLSCWSYLVEDQTYFVKLNENAKHFFRFEGNPEIIPHLLSNCRDSFFLGYPYGLIFADKMARISNIEKKTLTTNFLIRSENKELLSYLNTTNAHEILDNLG